MELGKLVTAEPCGSIYYFIIDDVHPDEPQHDALKHYYVVATASSHFSYREAYGVLCRALCSLDNRTFLHRWHSLYEEIFGTTPYVQFVDAVRNSPLVCLDSFPLTDEGCGSNVNDPTADARLPHKVPFGAGFGRLDASPTPMSASGTVALFSNETSARLALRKLADAEGEQRNCPPHSNGAGYSSHQGCCTPIHAQYAAVSGEAIHELDISRQPGLSGKIVGVAGPHHAKYSASPVIEGGCAPPQSRGNDLLDVTSRGKSCEPCSAIDAGRAVEQPQPQLPQKRERHMEAERQRHPFSKLVHEKPYTNAGEKGTHAAAAVSAAAPDAALEELRQQLHALHGELSEERIRHSKQREELLSENEQLRKHLVQQRREQSARIEQFLKENQDVVKRMEGALQKREEEVRAVYNQALQERDVRIAQLSQEVLQHTHESRQLASVRNDEERFHAQRVAHLEDMAVQLREWNLSLQRQLADASDEARRLRQRLEMMEAASVRDTKSGEFSSRCVAGEPSGGCFACGGLPRAHAVQLATQVYHLQQQLQQCREENGAKTSELVRAAQLIDALKDGLHRVRTDLSADFRTRAAATAVQLSPNDS
ncbi:hypothetical protein GH5_01056 [Leishmania sp. Ghana 2012 LV757]|uniref:hypothetical protein n=1 Tax=Leishmania sp. Ghana 2012 LV757 TaxID=2803181 RepID=UPI001B4DA429|nr:hypothetical protein GH5_01056 [Leishmania sp. Ghana 2012 LV757]